MPDKLLSLIVTLCYVDAAYDLVSEIKRSIMEKEEVCLDMLDSRFYNEYMP